MSAHSFHPSRSGRLRVAALIVFGLLVASCSNSGDSNSSSSTTQTPMVSSTLVSDMTTTTTTEQFQSITGVPGVTDTEINFASIGTGADSNILGTCTLECYSDGVEAYFAFRNSEGGVHSRQLKLIKRVDDELGNNQVKSLEIINDGDTFGVFSIPFIASGFPEFAKEGIPLYTTPISGLDTAGQLSSFALGGVTCINCTQKYSTYISQQVGATTIAALGYGVSEPSKACVAGHVASIEKHGKDLGLSVGFSKDDLPYALPNGVAPEVTAMKAAGVDIVFTCVDGTAVKTIAQEMKRQDMKAIIVLPGDGYARDNFFEDAGGLFEGSVMTITFRPFEADMTGTASVDFLKWMETTSPDTTDLVYAMWGWVSADLAYRGILDAGPVFDRASVVAATNTLEDYTGGGIYPSMDWTRQHDAPTEEDRITHGNDPQCTALLRIVGDKFELLGGQPDKPWVCWDPAVDAYTDPVLTNFTGD